MDIFKKSISILNKNQKKFLFFIFFLVLLNIILETLSLSLIIPIVALLIDYERLISYEIVKNTVEYLNLNSQNRIVISGLVLLLLVYTIKNIFLAFFSYVQIHFVYKINLSISNQLFAFYLNQPYIFHLDKNSAELIRNISTESSRVVDTIRSALQLVIETIILFFILALLIYIQPTVAVATFVVMGVTGIVSNMITRKPIMEIGQTRFKFSAEVLKNLLQGLNSIKETLIMWKQKSFINNFYNNQNKVLSATKKHSFIISLPRLWLEIIALLGLIVITFVMLVDDQPISNVLPILSLFAVAALRILPGINKVISSIQIIQYCKPSLDIIFDEFIKYRIIDKENNSDFYKNSKIKNNNFKNENTNFYSNFEEILLQNISFKYPNTDKLILDNINIKINKKSAIGIIGESGAGKSTFVDVFLGLLDPQKGKITVDNNDIRLHLKDWQTNIGYVPQNVFLSDDTIKNNIAFGLKEEDIDEKKLSTCIEMAQLKDFIKNLPNGVETVVGEHGDRLSGGQRQRLAIARSLYNNPQILVFDEATSSLDNNTEKKFVEVIRELQKKKTIIIVSHRLSSVKYCNKILKIENGMVNEQ